VTPDGNEDVVQFDVNRGEGEEAGDEELHGHGGVPLRGGDLTDGELGLGRRVEVPCVALAGDSTSESEREGDQEVHGEESYNSAEGESSGGVVNNGDGVEERPDDEEGSNEEGDAEQDVVHPVFAAELLVPHATSETSEKGSQGVDDDRQRQG